jgi:GNAT superfamily N-acetyltransferase
MTEIDRATVSAASEAWVLDPPDSEVVETAEYRIARFPERLGFPLQVQWVRTERPIGTVLAEIVARAREFGLPEANFLLKLSPPGGLAEALLEQGAAVTGIADVLALALPADLKAPELPGLELRWVTTPESGREANVISVSVFGGTLALEEHVAARSATLRDLFTAGSGGAVIAYLDGAPAGLGGVKIVDGVARLSGGSVLEEFRGRGVYRALVAGRLAWAAERGATMALTAGRVATSSPILRRLGFIAYGQERNYLLPLA